MANVLDRPETERVGVTEAEDYVDWLQAVETLVGKHGGTIFGGYCRDFLAYRQHVRDWFDKQSGVVDCRVVEPKRRRGNAAMVAAATERGRMFAQRCCVVQSVMDSVGIPSDVTQHVLLTYLEDCVTLVHEHPFKDMDVQFPDYATVCTFTRELQTAPEHTVELSPTSKLRYMIPGQDRDGQTLLDRIYDVETREHRCSGYKPWKRLQVECCLSTNPTFRLYIDMTWSAGRPFDDDNGVDYHCNRLRYHPTTSSFSLCRQHSCETQACTDDPTARVHWRTMSVPSRIGAGTFVHDRLGLHHNCSCMLFFRACA